MIKPCCLQEIDCAEYEKRTNTGGVPMLGGAIGKADKCPGDASEAHMFIQKSKYSYGKHCNLSDFSKFHTTVIKLSHILQIP